MSNQRDPPFIDCLETSMSSALVINDNNGINDYHTLKKRKSKNNAEEGVDNGSVDVSVTIKDMTDLPDSCASQVETLAKHVWHSGWRALPHHALPLWMQDNEYLLSGYRPPLPSVRACLASVFRMHTETINIWTHLLGALIFVCWFANFLLLPSDSIPPKSKPVITTFFIGAISCLICSTIFHIFSCHSVRVSKLFNKIDYCGISLLVVGSFIPWLYYAFHCRFTEKLVYLILLCVLGVVCISVSFIDKFGEPAYRSTRAGLFVVFGLCAVVPCGHHMIIFGVSSSFKHASITWLILMGFLYISGALLYANRIPERFFPGKFDILGQSHQIFHVLVVMAAAVHYYGIMTLAMNHHLLCPLNQMK
ncbi:hypothetical protein GJ496_008116 [Pomphorhynchus laevis]|nr:hypothetical protein GJ496_008116 [Pomphorhynchus laevis]